ncbi:MAG: hypothetical protein GY750_18220 [Lentisphaerae bacterium]|nr:hypothetical protein [Lentisphaerota bacterium]MCP4103333.1 hypothetical protein [Lentisphaerota bacterium]
MDKTNSLTGKFLALGRYWQGFSFGVLNGHYWFNIYINNGAELNYKVQSGAVAGQWAHLALTYDGSKICYYLNGQEVGSKSISGSLSKTDCPWHIGNSGNGAGSFDGLIDEVCIWKRALTAEDISDLYNYGNGKTIAINKTSLTDKLRAYWRMENISWNGTESEVVDLSDYGRHGMAFNANTVLGGKMGRAAKFTDPHDHVKCRGIDFNYPITYSAWIKPYEVENNGSALSRLQGDVNLGVGSNKYQFGIEIENQNYYYSTPGAVPNKWAHLAVTYDGSTVRYYVNGGVVFSIPASGNLSSTHNPWLIGASANGQKFFKGLIDEVYIWNKALDPVEIKRLYNDGEGINLFAEKNIANVLYTKLYGYWKLNRTGWTGNSGEVDDYSGNGFHGQAVNGATTNSNGKFDYAGCFNGGNHVQLSNLNINYPITYSAWINPTAFSETLSSALGCSGAELYFGVHYKKYALGLALQGGNFQTILDGALQAEWAHLAVTYDGSTVNSYVNGVKIDSCQSTQYLKPMESWQIGAHGNGANPFNGLVDEVAIWHRSLSEYEISKLYRNGLGLEITGHINVNPEVKVLEPQFCDPFYEQNDSFYLNGSWKLLRMKGEEDHILTTQENIFRYFDKFYDDSEWELVQVPKDISADPKDDEEPGTAYYRRSFNVPAVWTGKRVILYFEAIAWAPTVWVNGQKVAELTTLAPEKVSERHKIDITDAIQFGDRNQLTVRLYRHEKTRRLSTGIYGPVTIRVLPETYCERLILTPALPNTVNFKACLKNTRNSTVTSNLTVKISPKSNPSQVFTYDFGDQELQSGINEISHNLTISSPILWDVYNPYLYDFKLLIDGERAGWQRFGLREFKVVANHFELNGHKLYLPGISIDEGHLITPLRHNVLFFYNHNGFLRKYLELLKEHNCMVIYRQEEIASDIMNSICDELGLLQFPTPDIFMEEKLSVKAKKMILNPEESIPERWISEFPIYPGAAWMDPGCVIEGLISTEGVQEYIKVATKRNILALENHPSIVAITPEGESNRAPGVTPLLPDTRSFLNDMAPWLAFSSTHTFIVKGRPLDGTWQIVGPHPLDFISFAGLIFGGAAMNTVPLTMFQRLAPQCSWEWSNKYYPSIKACVATESFFYFGTKNIFPFYWNLYINTFDDIVNQDGTINKIKYAEALSNDEYIGWWQGRSWINIAGAHNCLDKDKVVKAIASRAKRMIEQARISDDSIHGVGSVCGALFNYDTDTYYLSDLNPDIFLSTSHIGKAYKAGFAPCMVCSLPQGLARYHLTKGDVLDLKMYCFNNYFFDIENVQLRVKVLSATDSVLDEHVINMSTLQASSKQIIPYQFHLSSSVTTGIHKLKLELEQDNDLIAENEYELFIGSKHDLLEPLVNQQPVCLYGNGDIADQTEQLLQSWGFEVIRGGITQALQSSHLIIAPGCIDENIIQNGSHIRQWLEHGGRLLCMEQNDNIQVPWENHMRYKCLNFPVYIPSSTIGLPELYPVGTDVDLIEPKHDVFRGINKKSLWAFWNSKYGEVYNCMLHPLSENVIASGRTLERGEKPMPFGMTIAERKFGQGHCIFPR